MFVNINLNFEGFELAIIWLFRMLEGNVYGIEGLWGVFV